MIGKLFPFPFALIQKKDVTLASPKIGCVLTIKEKKRFFLCIVLDFHYLCNR